MADTASILYKAGEQIGTRLNALGERRPITCTRMRDTQANIRARSGDVVGTLAFGTDTNALYAFDGSNWQIYNSN